MHLIEDNESIRQAKGFAATGGLFPSIKKQKEEAAASAAMLMKIRKTYPYPPDSCEKAIASIESIQDAIKGINEQISAGTIKKDEAGWSLAAHNQVLQEFKTFVNASQCIKKALAEEDQIFSEQLQQALDNENQSVVSTTKKNNLIIFGTLGILVIGSLVLILKK